MRCSGGARASGMSVGNPRCPRERTITAGSSISVRRLLHRGQASTSSRCRNDASKSTASPATGTRCGRRVGGSYVNRGGHMSPIIIVRDAKIQKMESFFDTAASWNAYSK